jgi:hypothetical protein
MPASGAVATVLRKRLHINMFTPGAPRDAFPFTNVNAKDVPKLRRETKPFIRNEFTFVNILALASAPQFPNWG